MSIALPRRRALANLILSLSSNTHYDSIAELSLSPVYQHQYASLYDVLDELSKDEESFSCLQKRVSQFVFKELGQIVKKADDRSLPLVVSSDVTPCEYTHAQSLPDRQAIVLPNGAGQSRTNLGVGYNLSSLNLSSFSGSWSLPLDLRRVRLDQTASQCAQEQLAGLLSNHSGIDKNRLVIHCADSAYGNSAFLAQLYKDHSNLVNIVRLKHGSKVFKQYERTASSNPLQYFGEQSYLIMDSDTKSYKKKKSKEFYEVERKAISETQADESIVVEEIMGRQPRPVMVTIERWNNYLLRSKSGQSMKEHPIDLLRIRCVDKSTGKPVFKRELYLAISGERKTEVSNIMGRQYYRSRQDIEAFFRTAKQHFLLTKFATSVQQHLDNFLQVVILASYATFLNADQVDNQPIHPWERYQPTKKKINGRVTMTQSIRKAQAYYCTLDLSDLSPPKSKGGIGRQKGHQLTPKTTYKVARKPKK